MKREAELKAKFRRKLHEVLPNFMLLEYTTAGAPDRSIVGGGRQTNWEFKHATPDFDSPGIQELECMRLSAAGHCRYVIWQESSKGGGRRTLIVRPFDIHTRTNCRSLLSEDWCVDFDMGWLVEQVRKAHGV
jgi:hypothetical protein